MKASRFSEAQKAFILKQGADGMPVANIPRKAGFSLGRRRIQRRVVILTQASHMRSCGDQS